MFCDYLPCNSDNAYHIFQPKRVRRKRVVKVEKDMMQKFMSPYERYTAYMEMKPLLEGGKRRKDTEAGDLERVSRVSQELASVWLLSLRITLVP